MKDYLASAQAILADNIYGTIATCSKEGWPWAAPQFIAYDDDTKTIYWCAARNSQHSQNIQDNGHIPLGGSVSFIIYLVPWHVP